MLEGMSTLVFVTHDVTPSQWSDFVKAAGPSAKVMPAEETIVTYILVSSPNTSTHLPLSRTPSIPTTIPSKLVSASFEDIKALHAKLYATAPRNIQPEIILLLDAQSFRDRNVVIFEKGVEWLTPQGEVAESELGDTTKMTVWRKYRVPYEEAFTVQCALEGFCDLGAAGVEGWFVGQVGREEYVVSEEEEEGEEESSSSEESGDSEFWEDEKV